MVTPPGTTDAEPQAVDSDPQPVDDGPRERIRFSSFSVIRAVLVIVGAIVVLQLVALADTTLWWLAIATVLAGLYEPAVIWLRRFLPGWLSMTVVVFGVVVLIGLLGYRGFDELSRQLASLKVDAVRTAQEIEESEQFGSVATEFGLTAKVEEFFADLPNEMVGGDAASAVQSAASNGGALFAIWTLSFLMMIFGRRIMRSAFAQLDDPAIADRARGLVLRAYADSSRYVWMMIFRALAVGVVSGLCCAALGVQTPTAFAVWFALLSLIPGLGIVVAAIPLAIFQSVSSAPLGLVILVIAIVVQMADVVVVQRRIDATSVHVGPGLMIVAALVGFQIYGPGGLLVMLAAVIFAMAFVHQLTDDHDNVVIAARALVAPTPTDG